MTENIVLIIEAIASICAAVAYIKRKFNETESTSSAKTPKQANLDTPCYDYL